MKTRLVPPCIVLFLFGIASMLLAQGTGTAITQARELMQKKNFPQAVNVLRAALKEKPKDPNLWVAMGYAQESAGDLVAALEAFKKAQQIKLGLEGVALKIITLEKKVQELKGQSAPAGDQLTEDQKKARAMLAKILKDWRGGKAESAFPAFLECAELDPTIVSDDQGIVQDAIRFYSVQGRAEIPLNSYNLGVYQHFNGALDEALAALRKALEGKLADATREKAQKRIAMIEEAKRSIAALAPTPEKPPSKSPSQQPKEPAKPQAVDSLAAKVAMMKATTSMGTEAPGGTGASGGGGNQVSLSDQLSGVGADQIFAQALEIKEKSPAKAINLISEALRKKPDPNMLLTLGDVYLSHSKANMSEAIDAYQRVVMNFPKSPLAQEAKNRIKALQPSTEQRSKEVAEYFEKHPVATPGD